MNILPLRAIKGTPGPTLDGVPQTVNPQASRSACYLKKRLLLWAGVFTLICWAGTAPAATYYIDFVNGSDGNSGTSANSPWKRHPYMTGWSGHYSHSAGDRFIFKGGVTWDSTCFSLSIAASGSPGNPDYYGVDQTWYSGAAWTRPVFDGQHVSSTIVSVSQLHYITLDSFEITRLMASANFGPGLVAIYNVDNLLITNCYLHDWQLNPAIGTDDAHGGVIGNFGGYGITNVTIDHCEISNAENSNRWNGVCVRQVGTINYTKIHDNSSAILFAGDVNHCVIYNICYPNSGFDGTYHFNGFYMDSWNGSMPITTPGYMRNSIMHDIGGGANMCYPNPSNGDKTIYVYNNIFYGVMSSQMAIEIDPYAYGLLGSFGTVFVDNNTLVLYGSSWPAVHVVNRPGNTLKQLVIENNHIIGISAAVCDGGGSLANNLIQTPSTATSQGYTLANVYAPILGGSTIGAGTSDPSSLFTTDINGVARPQGAWDIGAYQYVNSTNYLPPVVSAISQNASDVDPTTPGLQVYEGTVVQYSASASSPVGKPLTWLWEYSINGASPTVFQSGSGTVVPVSFDYATGTAGNTYLWTLQVSDGQSTVQSQLTVSVEAPPAPSTALTFQAAAGNLTAPMTVSNNAIYQADYTGVTNGGQATYTFTITNAGNYVIQALVNAMSEGNKSFYINIDGQPTDPAMIWDITLTTGFEERLVSWRGLGTFDSDQYVPKTFNLSPGPHELIIVGREAFTYLENFSLLKVPGAPQDLQVVPGPTAGP
jgi:hypothetical protein